ncbi:Hsp20/alpha crystallin family protein [Ramlibacter sp. MAHUQ-53]|uniref:Hsp20/alpha crystallin family protein n=1 Tax=unclassified Ramlibacter TaxID=2617605 RepID=UPI00362FCD59
MSSLTTRGSLFDDFFKDMAPGFFVRPLHGDPLPAPSQVAIDVKETERAYEVNAVMPGVDKKDIHVSVDGNVVSISAEVRQADEQKRDEKVLRSERYFGSVSRSFSLPQAVDEAGAQARYENGILKLVLPKQAAPSARRIEVA